MSEIMFVEGLISEEDLAHYGTPRHSGRYPWGSGKNPYHHSGSSSSGRSRSGGGSKMQLSDKQKKALKVGAIAAGAALATVGVIYLAKSGKINEAVTLGKAAADRALSKNRDQKLEAKRNREADKAIRKARDEAVKNRRQLSDEELDKRIKRLEKEKKLRDLVRDDQHRGKKEVDEVMMNTAKKVLGVAGGAVGAVGAEYLIRKYLNDEMSKEELAKAIKENMRPKKK